MQSEIIELHVAYQINAAFLFRYLSCLKIFLSNPIWNDYFNEILRKKGKTWIRFEW